MRNTLRLGVLIGMELAAVAALHSLGDLPWLQVPRAGVTEWATVTPPEDVVAALARLLALAGAYWLLASTLCYTVAAAARLPGAVRVAGWGTLPAVRRVADRAVAVALVTSSVMGPSAIGHASPAPGASTNLRAEAVSLSASPDLSAHPGASPDPGASPGAGASSGLTVAASAPPAPFPPAPSTGSDRDSPPFPPAAALPPGLPGAPPPDRGEHGTRSSHRPGAGERSPHPDESGEGSAHPDESGERSPDRTGAGARSPDPDQTDERPKPRVATHVAEPGDNLWSITAAHLEAAGADHDTAHVREAWREVVAANRDRLRSGDPDLIYPGESITLSPLPEAGSPSTT